MNTQDQGQDFTRLQHLLKLKRYETPPPRYFNDFSGLVVSRIRAGRTGGRYEAFENIVNQTPWLSRLWHKLERQPAFSGALAAITCGFIVAAVFLLEQPTPQTLNFMAVGEARGNGNAARDRAAGNALGNLLGNNFAATAAAPQPASSTNLLPVPNLFDQIVPGMPGRPMQPVPAAGLPLWQP